MHQSITFTIDVSADDDLSDAQTIPSNFRPVAAVLPTLDSTTITFQVQRGGGSYRTVNISTHGSAVAAYSLGNANTGAITQPIPEDLGRVLQGANVKIVTASQGSDRAIVIVCERVSP